MSLPDHGDLIAISLSVDLDDAVRDKSKHRFSCHGSQENIQVFQAAILANGALRVRQPIIYGHPDLDVVWPKYALLTARRIQKEIANLFVSQFIDEPALLWITAS